MYNWFNGQGSWSRKGEHVQQDQGEKKNMYNMIRKKEGRTCTAGSWSRKVEHIQQDYGVGRENMYNIIRE